MKSIELRPYQLDAIERLRDGIRAGFRNQILCAPTGSGKTIIGAHLINECKNKGKRAIFVCDRLNLVDQTSLRFDEFGIDHGIIQANHWRTRLYEPVQVASAQTLARRQWPDADLIIIDGIW